MNKNGMKIFSLNFGEKAEKIKTKTAKNSHYYLYCKKHKKFYENACFYEM